MSDEYHSYRAQMAMVDSGIICWASRVRDLLLSKGFGNVWVNQSAESVTGFAQEFKQRCVDMDIQSWHGNVLDFGSLRTYRIVKESLQFEDYVDMKISDEFRNLFTRIRGGLLNIRSNTGRWHENGLCYERRICQFCNQNVVENEFHFLFECRAWSAFRVRLNVYQECIDKDIKLVLNTDRKDLIIDVCRYTKQVLNFREEIMEVL